MIGIVMLVLCVGAGVAHDEDTAASTGYACPPESQDVQASREMMEVENGPTEIPTLDQAMTDLQREPDEIQKDVGSRAALRRVLYSANYVLPYYPSVRCCCPQPTYECKSVDIHVWYLYYGSHGFCFVIHPWGDRVIKRKKCTCVKCLYKYMYCPTLGKCVESTYQWYHAFLYCPWTKYQRKFFGIILLVPTACYCRPYCPWYYHSSVATAQIDRADDPDPSTEP